MELATGKIVEAVKKCRNNFPDYQLELRRKQLITTEDLSAIGIRLGLICRGIEDSILATLGCGSI